MQIEIKNLGPVPSFKNRKRIAGKRVVADPEVQHWMNQARESIALQLHSIWKTSGGGTSMECLQQFLTACVPHDDCWTIIPEIVLRGEKVKLGGAGCSIKIDILN